MKIPPPELEHPRAFFERVMREWVPIRGFLEDAMVWGQGNMDNTKASMVEPRYLVMKLVSDSRGSPSVQHTSSLFSCHNTFHSTILA